MKTSLALFVVCGAMAVASNASAQTAAWGDNGFISFNGLYQSTPISFTTTSKLDINQESGEVRTGHRVAPGPLFDITAGGKLSGNLGMSYAFSYRRQTELGQVSATVPHPFYFNQLRPVAGEASLKREDIAFHIDAMWLLPVSDRLQLSMFGGPTYFRVAQDMVSTVETHDAYPFDQAEYTGATLSNEHASHFGFNAGADVTVFFTRALGVNGVVRFSQGTIDMPVPGGGSSSVKVGGLQTGAGLRVRF